MIKLSAVSFLWKLLVFFLNVHNVFNRAQVVTCDFHRLGDRSLEFYVLLAKEEITFLWWRILLDKSERLNRTWSISIKIEKDDQMFIILVIKRIICKSVCFLLFIDNFMDVNGVILILGFVGLVMVLSCIIACFKKIRS